MFRTFVFLGAINGFLAVAFGAFGAHGLRNHLSSDMMAVYQTGVQYHFYHALGLVLIGLVATHLPHSGSLRWAGWLMLAGIVLFSGSLYALSISGVRWLGVITPFGGTAFLAAWVLLAVSVWRGMAGK